MKQDPILEKERYGHFWFEQKATVLFCREGIQKAFVDHFFYIFLTYVAEINHFYFKDQLLKIDLAIFCSITNKWEIELLKKEITHQLR